MMYAITRGPSKLVTQRRTGPTQQLDKINDFKHKQTSWNMPDLPAAKIVFNRLNGKKYHHHPASALPASGQPEDRFTPAHQENVEFAYDVGPIRTFSVLTAAPLDSGCCVSSLAGGVTARAGAGGDPEGCPLQRDHYRPTRGRLRALGSG
ncbi:MAPK regulated corepressor interacting protein 2-like isoform X1 [Embiotoca jacksoni]|uniref:MAPK regulated corepressor interacting protein 2-like isoform X1 n=1 Tax=Embiotoca jacksoni TaxID=100190 RepID=UPI003703914D